MNTAADFLDLLGDAAVVLVWMIALARLTRLLTVDRITDFLRAWAWKAGGETEDSAVWYFSTCPWCVSLWLALGSAPLLLLTIGLSMWWFPVFGLLGSWFVGVSAVNFEGEHDDIEIIEDDQK